MERRRWGRDGGKTDGEGRKHRGGRHGDGKGDLNFSELDLI